MEGIFFNIYKVAENKSEKEFQGVHVKQNEENKNAV
jgi:hypothetical protein